MRGAREYLGFNDTWFMIIGILAIGSSMPFVFFEHTVDEPPAVLRTQLAVSYCMTLLYWIGSRTVLILWRRNMSDPKLTVRRNLAQVATVLTYSIAVEFAVKSIANSLAPEAMDEHPISGLAGTYLITFLVLAIYEAIYLYAQWHRALVEKEHVKQEHLKSQLQGLRNQVNPHFLFNSLNTLASIVTEDQQLAVSYVQKLSQVFRHVLENRHEQLITLQDELDFIHNYVFLQKERFQENLNVSIYVEDKFMEKLIVPLSLQILFENAIKHNVISSRKPLSIQVYVNEVHKLVVGNTLQLKSQESTSTRVGLQNIKDRYRFFTEQSIDISETDKTFTVAIPLLHFSNGTT